MVGARVNGNLVPIEYEIQNGDRVEIVTSQNSKGPSRDWLSIVKSAQAKNKINQWFRMEFKEENITRGRDLLANYCKTQGIVMSDLVKPEYTDACKKKYGFRDWVSVLAAIGHGGLKEGQVINKLQYEYDKKNPKHTTDKDILEAVNSPAVHGSQPAAVKSKSGIVVAGIDDVSVRFSKCCSPVPGDEIVGFVTRGRGVSIHRTDCINILNLPEIDRARLIDAEWEPEESEARKEKYLTEIAIYAHDRSGLLVDVSKTLTEKNIDIRSINTRTGKQEVVTLIVSFLIGSREELNAMIEKIRMIDSVIDIERTTG